MKSILVKFLLLISSVIIVSCASSNKRVQFDKMIGSGKPVFYYNLLKSFGRDRGEFKVTSRYKIEYDRLHFEKKSDSYISKFSVSFAVFLKGEDIPLKQMFLSKEISVDNFSDTDNHKLFDHDQFELYLPVGEYRTELKIESKSGNGYYKKVEDLSFWYEDTFGVTNLTLYKSDGDLFNLESMKPIISNRIDEDCKNIGVYFEILSEEPIDYTVNYSLFNSDEQLIHSDRLEKRAEDRVTREIIALSLNDTKIGNYFFRVEILIGDRRFERYVPFTIRWRDDTAEISSLDEAINNLVYLVDSTDSLSTVLNYDQKSKREWFQTFWGKLNSEGDDKNILMDEYYRRVNFSNVNFSAGMREGWKSDRGQIFIIFGEPDEIQKYEYARNVKPYEVWVYYGRGRQFIFDYIAGDYKLRRK